MRNLSVRHPPINSGSSTSVLSRHGSSAATRRVTLVFNNLQPAELAEQLTFLEYKAFRRITVRLNLTCMPLCYSLCFCVVLLIFRFWHFGGLWIKRWEREACSPMRDVTFMLEKTKQQIPKLFSGPSLSLPATSRRHPDNSRQVIYWLLLSVRVGGLSEPVTPPRGQLSKLTVTTWQWDFSRLQSALNPISTTAHAMTVFLCAAWILRHKKYHDTYFIRQVHKDINDVLNLRTSCFSYLPLTTPCSSISSFPSLCFPFFLSFLTTLFIPFPCVQGSCGVWESVVSSLIDARSRHWTWCIFSARCVH